MTPIDPPASGKLSRRQALAGAGAVGLAGVLAACGADEKSKGPGGQSTNARTTAGSPKRTMPGARGDLFDASATCKLTPAQAEGPYYFDVDSIRSDIREGKEGTLLRLALRVRDAQTCEPIENAVVDVWHCDAAGLYSGFESASTGGGGGGLPGGSQGRTDEETYLRGAQATDAEGIVEFKTVYPGWYGGRTVHIHAKVHLNKTEVLTTQLYFDDSFTADVYENEPYSQDTGRDAFNDSDGIFSPDTLLTLTRERDGVLGVMTFDVQRG
jgi:protocatechuate 3,4-dioxygenase beta subunit